MEPSIPTYIAKINQGDMEAAKGLFHTKKKEVQAHKELQIKIPAIYNNQIEEQISFARRLSDSTLKSFSLSERDWMVDNTTGIIDSWIDKNTRNCDKISNRTRYADYIQENPIEGICSLGELLLTQKNINERHSAFILLYISAFLMNNNILDSHSEKLSHTAQSLYNRAIQIVPAMNKIPIVSEYK